MIKMLELLMGLSFLIACEEGSTVTKRNKGKLKDEWTLQVRGIVPNLETKVHNTIYGCP